MASEATTASDSAEQRRLLLILGAAITIGAAVTSLVAVHLLTLLKAGGLTADERLPFAIGIITAGLVGYACIAWLLRYLQRATTVVFTVYRVLLGVIVLVLLLVRS